MTTLVAPERLPAASASWTPDREPEADLLGLGSLLDERERAKLAEVRDHFQTVVRPLSIDYWNRGAFPFELLPGLAGLGLVGAGADGQRPLLTGLMQMEMARGDLSVSTFFGVHNELFTAAVQLLGSDEQRAEYLPGLRRLERIGAFALTEPEHGSDISRAMTTTARRDGGDWVITGAKRWIGSGTFADHLLVWARDASDGQIKGFIVDRAAPGVTTRAIENKIAARIVQNADIELDGVRVPVAARLPGANSFRDTNGLLTRSRAWVAWQAVGLQFAAFDVARAYALGRSQFGTPIAGKQLIQEQLARMAANMTASQALMVQIARLQEEGRLAADHAALAKATTTTRMRETVALGRSILGGNGIVTDFEAAKVFADAEAVYSYEGSYEVNALVVGRALTGLSAF